MNYRNLPVVSRFCAGTLQVTMKTPKLHTLSGNEHRTVRWHLRSHSSRTHRAGECGARAISAWPHLFRARAYSASQTEATDQRVFSPLRDGGHGDGRGSPF